ncbi:MAG: AMP-binding protein [Pseudomonadota bacterium]
MNSRFKDMGKYPPAVNVERRENGEILLTCPYPPREMPGSMPHILRERAGLHPDQPLLATRRTAASGEGHWESLTYGEAWHRVVQVAGQLRALGLGQDNSVMIASPRSFSHFCLAFGAQLAGVPISPVSAPYSLLSKDHAKLKYIAGLIRPSVILVDDVAAYEPALTALDGEGLLDNTLVLAETGPGDNRFGAVHFDDWLQRAVDETETRRYLDELDFETVARYMFTSGSTGMPKGVIYTQGMMMSSLAMQAGLNRDAAPDAPGEASGARVLEWMPWSHTGAGVMRLNSVVAGGGTIYFDTGRPVPGEYADTLRNIREVVPTMLSGAPVGFAMLADALEADDDLNRLVFGNVTSLGFGSAAMSPALFERLQALSIKATGERIGITSSLASTEVIGATSVYWPMENTGTIGLPIPGITAKLVPNGDKLEFRVKGGTVTQGYFRDPEKTRDSFDEEGFFKMGDAVRFVDPEHPERGLAFDGRVAEEFKLITGTWVSAGTLRTQLVSATSPLVRDAIICGLNQPYVAVMLWPNVNACRELLKLPDASVEAVIEAAITSSEVNQAVTAGLESHNRQMPGSSTRIERYLWLAEPPSMDGNELTEKGYINQRATLTRRASLVDALYSDPPSRDVWLLAAK